MKNFLGRLFITLSLIAPAAISLAQDEAADALIKRIGNEIMDTVKNDKEIQAGNRKKIDSLVESKVIPFINFDRMTSLAVGKNWRSATPDQQKQLVTEFRTLLIHTYSGAISQAKDQKIEYKPLRAAPTDTEVEVRSTVTPKGGEPAQLYYRMEKAGNSWKIYDINILGAWLVESYKGSFATEVSKSGIDGLIKTLQEKNKKLEATNKK